MLGALLLIMFVNDIVHGVYVKMKLYAEDCVMYSQEKSSDDQVLLKDEFQYAIASCAAWQMPLHFDKAIFVRVTHKKEPFKFYFFSNNDFLFEVKYYECI